MDAERADNPDYTEKTRRRKVAAAGALPEPEEKWYSPEGELPGQGFRTTQRTQRGGLTMKKAATFGLAVLLTVLGASCAPQATTGAAAGEALIKLMPKGTTGVMAIDVRRAMGTEAAKKTLQDPKAKEKYDEFVKMSGIDPMKDVAYVGIGLTGTMANLKEGGVIINMKYDQARIRALIKEKAPESTEEAYNGIPVFSNLDGSETEKTTRAAFLDATHIVLGSENGVKAIIDVRQKKAESIGKDPLMASVLKKVDKSGFAWGAFVVPQDMVKKAVASSPQLKVLEGFTAMTMSFDYRLSAFVADIRAHGGTKEQNENLASTLNGFKSLGAMFAAQEPLAGEALNGVEISAGADYTRLSINLPQEVLDKLGKMAESKAGDYIKDKKKDEPAGEIK
jgi:hypothetical protein